MLWTDLSSFSHTVFYSALSCWVGFGVGGGGGGIAKAVIYLGGRRGGKEVFQTNIFEILKTE